MQTAILPPWTARAPCHWCRCAVARKSRLRDGPNFERWTASRRQSLRYFTTSRRTFVSLDVAQRRDQASSTTAPKGAVDDDSVARGARLTFGNVLPEGFLTPDQLKIYVRLYGEPIFQDVGQETTALDGGRDTYDEIELESGTGVMVEGPDGVLQEVEFEEDVEEFDEEGEESATFEDTINSPEFIRLRKSKKGKFFARAKKKELDDTILFAEMSKADEAALAYLDKEWRQMDPDEQAVYLDDVRYMKLDQYLRDCDKNDEADELLQCLYIFIESQAASQEVSAGESDKIQETQEDELLEEEELEDDQSIEDPTQRTHPFTLENRFSTFPSTLQLPKQSFTGPVSAIISGSSATHLADAAQRIFGGPGLPYSTSNPHFARSMLQKPIPLDVTQDKMSEIEADAYFAAIMPGTYAGLMSVLVETRKRLGSKWLTNLINKEGGPRILDAGSGGAGVIAVRELLRAEWERLNDDSEDPEASTDLTTPDGREGGAPIAGPEGRATVLIANSALRQRASVLLDNTTFIPRLPDYVHASDLQAAQQGKFDIVLAPHSLWSLKEDFLRKQHMANLWSLLSADGGVLVLLEKGVPRGFEAIAGARKFLLGTRIASPDAQNAAEEITEPGGGNIQGVREKGKGMIIAPCTNHSACPMYTRPGLSPGRKDYCHFEQRYVRPPYLQKLVGARDKNHEDVKFSYLSIMRGRDLRKEGQPAVVQGDGATERAFQGFEDIAAMEEEAFDPTAPAVEDVDFSASSAHQPPIGPSSLTLPRLILPPLKRTGHVILDLCTPSGTLERWTVSKSFSRQAFRDARKSAWGDLWALGAKTRVLKNVRLGGDTKAKGHSIDLKGVRMKPKAKKALAEQPTRTQQKKVLYDVPVNPMTGRANVADVKRVGGGKMRQGKISGIRDKRNKSGRQRVRRDDGE